VEADATKTLKIVANSEDKISKTDIVHSRGTSLEYNPNRKLSVSSGVQTRTDPTSTLNAGSFGAGLKPFTFLDLNGSVKVRDQVDTKGQNLRAPDSMAITAGVSIPDGKLKLTAGVTENPEDAMSGAISRVRRKTVGVQSKLGVFDLNGSVSADEDYLSGGEGSILDVNVGYRLGKFTQIVTGLRDSTTLGTETLFQRTYTLGLTHKYGSLLDLSFGGTYSNTYRNGLLQPNPEMRAEAKVGIRF
jgi:hypothetical protein